MEVLRRQSSKYTVILAWYLFSLWRGPKCKLFCQVVEVFSRDHPICSHYRGIQIKEVQISESLLYSFLLPDSCSLKLVMSPKNYFSLLFWKILFFSKKNCWMKNIQNVDAYKKGYIDFCRQMLLSPQNCHVLPQISFSQFSPKILLFSKSLFRNKTFVS